MTILVTGGAGFIGTNFVLNWCAHHTEKVINLDNLTYAGNLQNLDSLKENPQHIFIKGDIADTQLVKKILSEYRPQAVINFAAESHVDRSILGPEVFVQTNIVGTFRLLDISRHYWQELSADQKNSFRFLHVSTDEVYGSLSHEQSPFTEENPYQPNSPYAASKASSDHLVRAYYHTYGLPVLTSHCSNNYGPYQFPEKLIPLIIYNALSNKKIPVYGDGQQVRDWLYVGDHCDAVLQILSAGQPGQTYNIGGWNEKKNLDVVHYICDFLDKQKPRIDSLSYAQQIQFVKDRPGHDQRYAIDARKIKAELNWQPKESFESGIKKTISWYLKNSNWVENITNGGYRDWVNTQYTL